MIVSWSFTSFLGFLSALISGGILSRGRSRDAAAGEVCLGVTDMDAVMGAETVAECLGVTSTSALMGTVYTTVDIWNELSLGAIGRNVVTVLESDDKSILSVDV